MNLARRTMFMPVVCTRTGRESFGMPMGGEGVGGTGAWEKKSGRHRWERELDDVD